MPNVKFTELNVATSLDPTDIVVVVIDPAGTPEAKTITFEDLKESLDIPGSASPYVEIAGTSQTAAINTAYGANNASLVTITLPASAVIGSIVEVIGIGAGGWRVAQASGQIIHFGSIDTTSGATGYIESTHRRDTVILRCVVADTDWQVVGAVGNLTVV